MKENSPYFTAGEFAEICSTTKDTLYHYERLGILKPAKTAPNGYRYYHAFQFFDYDVIAVLKEAGSSLAEIKAYLRLKNPNEFLEILKQRRQALAAERRKLEYMERRLGATIDLTARAIKVPYFFPRVIYQKKEYLAAVPLAYPLSHKDAALKVHELYDFSERVGDGEPPLGMIVPRQRGRKGGFSEGEYYVRLNRPVNADKLLIKPAGKYVCLRYKGAATTAFSIALNYIAEKKLEITGDAYEYELIGYLAAGDEADYVISLSIQVG